jgi:tetratricopeptide (TPR) repeat protein
VLMSRHKIAIGEQALFNDAMSPGDPTGTDSTELAPAQKLTGVQLGQWIVEDRVAKSPRRTGGCFSITYHARHVTTGQRGFVKAVDLRSIHQVIPRWMTYIQSLFADEFGRLVDSGDPRSVAPVFYAELEEFYKSRNARIGADLFERSIVMGLKNETLSLAPFVAEQKNLSKTLRAVAERVLTGAIVGDENDYDVAIRKHRQLLAENPRNAIRWAELARLYTIKRNTYRAVRAIRTALQLSPSDRYVVRSALRLFIHLQDDEQLLSVCGEDIASITDPWIKGVSISALLIAGKAPKRKIIPNARVFPKEAIFDYSEYLSACGMLEIHFGKGNQAKQLFTGSWADPSGNVTTHAEWVTRTHFPGLRSEISHFKQPTPEAKAGVAFSQGLWGRMNEAVVDWRLQEPFSKRPLRFLANAENVQAHFDKTLAIISEAERLGALDYGMAISKIYALLCTGRLDEARSILCMIPVPDEGSASRCVLIANWALLELLLGETKTGLDLYSRAEREGSLLSLHFRDRVFIYGIVARRMAGLGVDDEQLTRVKKVVGENPTDIEIQQIGKRAIAAEKVRIVKCNEAVAVPSQALIDCTIIPKQKAGEKKLVF